LETEAHLSETFPLGLFAFVIIVLAAMPWHRPHPKHQFMLALLQRHLEDKSPEAHESLPMTNDGAHGTVALAG